MLPILGSGVDIGDAIGGADESDIPGGGVSLSEIPGTLPFINSINLSDGTLIFLTLVKVFAINTLIKHICQVGSNVLFPTPQGRFRSHRVILGVSSFNYLRALRPLRALRAMMVPFVKMRSLF